jgi:hypothetical protein
MIQLITKLSIIGAIVGGFCWLVTPWPLAHGNVPSGWVMVGWCFVVVTLVYLTWRIELRRLP